MLNLGFSSMSIVGPALAGFLVAGTASRSTLIGITAGIFAICAVLMGTSAACRRARWTRRPGSCACVRARRTSTAHPVVRPLVLGESLLLVLFTMASPIEIVYAKESLGGGDATYGTLLTAWGAGVIIGSLLFARVHSRPLPVLIAGSTVIIGFAYVGMAAAPTLGSAAAAAVLGGIGNGMQWVVVVTAIQEAVRDDMQARVAGFFEAVATAVPGVGFIWAAS